MWLCFSHWRLFSVFSIPRPPLAPPPGCCMASFPPGKARSNIASSLLAGLAKQMKHRILPSSSKTRQSFRPQKLPTLSFIRRRNVVVCSHWHWHARLLWPSWIYLLWLPSLLARERESESEDCRQRQRKGINLHNQTDSLSVLLLLFMAQLSSSFLFLCV